MNFRYSNLKCWPGYYTSWYLITALLTFRMDFCPLTGPNGIYYKTPEAGVSKENVKGGSELVPFFSEEEMYKYRESQTETQTTIVS